MKKEIRKLHLAVVFAQLLMAACIWLCPMHLHAQSQPGLYSTLTAEKWLPSNNIRVIFQDSRGFMWIGTNSGLFRYNLYSAVNINLTQKSTGRLLNNTIHAVAEDSYGNIFVGTESGLGVIDVTTGNCNVLSSTDETITRIILGKNNLLWIVSDSGNVYRVNSQPYKNYHKLDKPLVRVLDNNGTPLKVRTVFEMPDGRVLLGTEKGIYKVDINKKQALATQFNYAVTRIYSADFLHLYVGTERNGLFLLKFSDSNLNSAEISFTAVKLGNETTQSERIVSVSGINRQNIVAATKNGVYLSTKPNMPVFASVGPASLTKSIGYITYMYVDRTANIWLGSQRGLFKLKRQSLLVTDYEIENDNANYVNALLNDGSGHLWVSTEQKGLYMLNTSTHKLKRLTLPYNSFHAVKKASSGSILATSGGTVIEVYPPNSSAGIVYRKLISVGHAIQDMYEVEPGEWWLATWKDGLLRYIERGKEDSTKIFQQVKKLIGSDAPVFCITKDSKQRIWIGTRGKGIYRVDLGTHEIKRFNKTGKEKNRSNRIISIFEDSRKRVWIGTRGDGLLLYKPEQDEFISFGLNNGLPSNSICGIEENTSGEIWVSTQNGIARYQPGSKVQFQSYNAEDGILLSEFNFNAAAAGDDNEIYFGNNSGFYSFHKTVNPSHAIFPAVFTNLEIYTKDKLSANSAISESRNQNLMGMLSSGNVVLNSNQNSIGISFAALDFTNPERNRYLYRMVGLDNTWKFDQGPKVTASFYDLPAGSYVFQVLSSNSRGTWNDKPITLKIKVDPYFWLTPLAMVIYFLVFTGVVVAAYILWRRWYKLRERLQQETAIAQKHSQQMVLYTDLSHEIKNRLSLILGPLELALSDKKVNEAVLNNLYNQTQRLKRLTDQILNIRRTDSGGFILHVAEENIFRLVERLYTETQPLASIKEVDFTFKPMKEPLEGWCDEELLEIIVMNLLGNAVKYVNVQGNVEVRMDIAYLGGNDLIRKGAPEGNYLVLSISNTGQGIVEEDIKKVTQLFYRSTNAKQNDADGAGIGLNLVARLVDLHHGGMEILSESGVTTTVTTQIPIDKFQYSIAELKASMISVPIVMPIAGQDDPVSYLQNLDGITADTKPALRKILVVDDKPELAALVKQCLQTEFDVRITLDGNEALDMIEIEDFDLIISDLAMPAMDGLTFCRLLRANARHRHIPFIILTGRNSKEQELICFKNGVDDFIEKPFSPELLKWRVKSLLRPVRAKAEQEKKNIVIVTPGANNTESPEETFIQRIVNIIEEHIDKDFLDADFLAEQNFMSRATFYRKMESLVGESPSIFIRKYRLNKAAKLLLSRHYNISTVAGKVGFTDPKYFSKCFQKEFGLTPSEYVERNLVTR